MMHKKMHKKMQHKSRTFLWLKNAIVNGSNMSRKQRRRVYIQTASAALFFVWIIVITVIAFTPTAYVSKWTLILPGAGAGAIVSIESIGQANSSSNSPYASSAIDPRENYKAIASSNTLLIAAAKLLNVPPAEVGKPKLKLPSQTGIIEFSIKAKIAKAAQDKAWAHYNSLQKLLNLLREDEIKQRENSIRIGMEGFVNKVGESHDRILNFQTETGMVSAEQFTELALTVEKLRHARANMEAKLYGLDASIKTLEQHLSLTTLQASDLLKLKNDQLYRQLLINYAQSTAILAELNGHHGYQHPKLINQRNKQAALLGAMKKRSQTLVGYQDEHFMLMLSADNSDGRAILIQELLTLTTEAEGLRSELSSLTQQIKDWDQKLIDNNDEIAKLNDLNREYQVATAVFTSALAKMDVGKADIYSAYPLVQLLEPPTLPYQPDKLYTLLAIVGGIAATLLIFIGLSLLWIRKPILRKILTND
ncbi:exopolysaccharide biosynthesis protein [Shewanella surugensis]|uniref:Exopolysaccharide biosynthesis protein n=1 Tax=Shewanella surugensis TaxID=212020 RepID=A0ABT0LB30_9GAMM|nr:exopolysaccharide biosynthesis protein [Shewanella surugensis]MCL1124908.1 exopolysaccharide biosynthesis protein [Shewanella surugensis]